MIRRLFMKADLLEKVKASVPKGKANAIHLNELAELLNMHPAAVKKAIKEARKTEPIVSGQRGYWIAESREEMEVFVKSMHKQAISRLSSSKFINENLKQLEGQISFTDSNEQD